MHALLLALALQVPSSEAEFVPVLHHGRKTTKEWLAELDASRGSSTRAVWALHYSGDRSIAVVQGLVRWAKESKDLPTRRAIDTLLVDWKAALPDLGAAQYAGTDGYVAAMEVLPAPDPLANVATADLFERLDSDDVREAAVTSAALLRRREHVDAALVALLHVRVEEERRFPEPPLDLGTPEGLRKWCQRHAGSAWVRALAGALERADGDEQRLAFLRAMKDQYAHMEHAARALEPLLGSTGEVGELAKELWHRAVKWYGHDDVATGEGEWALHRAMEHDELGEAAEASLDRVMGARLERALERDELQRELLYEVHPLALRSKPLAERCKRLLDPLIDRDDAVGLEALRILCHLRITTAHTKQCYLERLAAWGASGGPTLLALPCWPEHDSETLAAFTRVVEGARNGSVPAETFRFAGLLDAAQHPIVQKLLDACTPGGLYWMIGQGFRGRVAVGEDWLPEQKINALAMNLATAAAHGEETAQLEAEFASVLGRPYDRDGAGGYSDYVQWGFFHARTLVLRSPAVVELALKYAGQAGYSTEYAFSTHTDAAIAYLDTAELTLEDEVRVQRLLPYHAGGPGWMGINIVNPKDGGITRRRTAIELVPAMRLALYGGNVRALADLLAVTKATERDLDYLVAALDRGAAWDRASALDLVDDHALDGPRVVAAVKRACDDVAVEVALVARRIRAARGW